MRKKVVFRRLFFFFLIQQSLLLAHFRSAEQPEINNIFYDMPTIETERLILRESCMDDAPDLFEVFSSSEVLSLTPVKVDETIEDTQKRIEHIHARAKKGIAGYWCIELKEENKAIGICGFFNFSLQHASAEMFGILAKNYWSRGLITEAEKAMITCAFEQMGLNRIDALVYPGNVASIRVKEKLGFRVIGTIPEYYYGKGGYWDRIIMSLLKNDFCGYLS